MVRRSPQSGEPRTTQNANARFSERMPWERVPEYAIRVVHGSRLAAQNAGEFPGRALRGEHLTMKAFSKRVAVAVSNVRDACRVSAVGAVVSPV
jgi:hypothetical protein